MRFLQSITAVSLLVSFNASAETPRLKEGTESVFAASLLEGLIANNQSIQSFSVAYRLEQVVMPPGQLKFREETVRCVKDAERGRAILGRTITTDVAGEDGNLKTSKSTYVIQVGVNREGIMINATGKHRLKFPANIPLSKSIHLPTFHSIGMIGFPHVAAMHGPDDPIWMKQSIAQDGISAALAGDSGVSVTRTVYENGNEVMSDAWMFDLGTICPSKHRCFYFDTILKKIVLQQEETYVWKEINGICVPVEIHQLDKQKMRVAESEETVEYARSKDTTFYWNSVSEEMDEAATSLSQIDSMEEVSKWIQSGFPTKESEVTASDPKKE